MTSPAIGAYLSASYGDNLVVLLATLIALADICFILMAVPESLPDKMRLSTWGAPISWEQADPFAVRISIQNQNIFKIKRLILKIWLLDKRHLIDFFLVSQSLRKVGQDTTVLLICITVFLSYLPEAGQYSSFFLYLRQVLYLFYAFNKKV